MIWTFILGAVAGWCAPFAEERWRHLLETNLPGGRMGPAESRGVALALCLLVTAILARMSGAGGAVPLTLGAVVGVLGMRLIEKARMMRAPDYDS